MPIVDFLKPGERILTYFKCSRINPFNKRDGEILIGDNCVFFIDDGKNMEKNRLTSSPKNLIWPCENIMEIHKRRYLLKNNALVFI